MEYRHIEVKPISGALGAEIHGVDIARPTDGQFAEIRQAFLENQVIFFRDQKLTPDEQKGFARRFGELSIHPVYVPLDGHPEILPVVKEPTDKHNIGDTWHSDVTFAERPPLGSILYALEVPPYGGDTLWANQYLAYEALSEGMRRILDGMRAVHSDAFLTQARAERNVGRSTKLKDTPSEATENVHPVVRTHPETGRKALFVNYPFTARFEGMTREESLPLLEFLCRHASKPELTCRFRWEKGSVAFWDNRCTQHYALNDYHGFRREMHRVTVEGDRPA